MWQERFRKIEHLLLDAISMNVKENHFIDIFNDCFSKHKDSFIRFACSYVRDREVAADIVYESFADVWESLQNGTSIDSLPAYTLGMIKFKCMNYLRHEQIKWRADDELKEFYTRQNEMNLFSLSTLEPSDFYSRELEHSLKKVLEEFSDQTRKVFILSRYDQLSNKEIASRLGISVKGVEFHISKALKLLRERLRDYLIVLLIFFLQIH